MKLFIPLLLLLLLVVSASQAQNKGSIKGTVAAASDGALLEFATVAVVEPRDSSLVSYTLTTKDGAFALRNLPAEHPLKIIISFVGYQNFRKTFTIDKGETLDLGKIQLETNSQLAEVVVTGERQPVVFKKDTIEFNVEAFKTRPNAVVEDLLKKLPGLQVDMDGTITVNGRSVSKITVDGKDFFASDITVASKNINVDLIDKIQIIDDREDDPDRLKDDSQVAKIINLKLKKAIKKSMFGKVYAGQGTDGRYENGGMLNMFRDTLQLSVIGFSNNVNRAAFSNNELNNLGGLGRAGTSTYESGIDVGGRSWGLQRIASGGFNLNYDIKKKLKANLMYFYNNTGNNSESQGYTISNIKTDTTLFTTRRSEYENNQFRHNINGLVQWQIDTAAQIRYTPRLTYSQSRSTSWNNSAMHNNFGDQVNESYGNGNGNGENIMYEHRFNYYRRLRKKDQSFNITNNIRLSPNSNIGYGMNDFVSFKKIADELTRQELHQDVQSLMDQAQNSGNFDVYYRHPHSKKVTTDYTVSALYESNIQTRATYELNPETKQYDIFLQKQSSDLQRDQYTYRFRPGVTWNVADKKVIRAGAALQRQDVFNTFRSTGSAVNRTFYHVLPSIQYSAGQFSANYNMNMRQPSIYQIQPDTITNLAQSSTGNPDLKPINSHSGYLSYRKSIPESQIDYNFNSNFTYNESSVVQTIITNTTDGRFFYQPTTAGNTYYTWNNAQISKRFKKVKDLQTRVSASVNLSNDKSIFSSNGIADILRQYSAGSNFGLSLNWKELVQLEPNYNISRNFNRYDIAQDKNINATTQRLNNLVRVSWPKKTILEVNYLYTYNSLIGGGFAKTTNLLNASLSYQMLKNKGEVKLTGFDLLNQNRGIYSYVNNNEQNTGTQLVLRRYFMLTFQYNFNKTITK